MKFFRFTPGQIANLHTWLDRDVNVLTIFGVAIMWSVRPQK